MFLAYVLLKRLSKKAAKGNDPKTMSRDAAEVVIYKKLTEGRKKAPYSMREVFGETKPVGVRQWALDPKTLCGRVCQSARYLRMPCLSNRICSLTVAITPLLEPSAL